jgi:hypothetical protein
MVPPGAEVYAHGPITIHHVKGGLYLHLDTKDKDIFFSNEELLWLWPLFKAYLEEKEYGTT